MESASEAVLLRPPGLPLPEHLVAHIFSMLPPKDRAHLAQVCKYTAHVARAYHVYADVPCVLTATNRDQTGMVVEQRRRSVEIEYGNNIVVLLQAFCDEFASHPYQVRGRTARFEADYFCSKCSSLSPSLPLSLRMPDSASEQTDR